MNVSEYNFQHMQKNDTSYFSFQVGEKPMKNGRRTEDIQYQPSGEASVQNIFHIFIALKFRDNPPNVLGWLIIDPLIQARKMTTA